MDDKQLPLPETEIEHPFIKRRRNLLPWWVKIFIWIFLLFLLAMPVAIIFDTLKYNFNLALLGLSTNNPLSALGFIIMAFFLLKGITAIGLWTEKKWAVGLAQFDAIISIVVCSGVTIYSLVTSDGNFNLRLELFVLIPYLIKMNRIKKQWVHFGSEYQV